MIKVFLGNERYFKDGALNEEKEKISYALNMLITSKIGAGEVEFVQASPLLDDYRLLIFETDVLKSDDLLEGIVKNDNDNFLLIISCKTVDKRSRLYKMLSDKVVEFNKLEYNKLKMFLRTEFESFEKRIEDESLDMIITSSDYLNNDAINLYSLKAVVKQIIYASDNELIDKEVVSDMVLDISTNVVWDLADAMALKNKSRALEILNKLLDSGENEIALLSGLLYMFRVAYKVRIFGSSEIKANPNNPFLIYDAKKLNEFVTLLTAAISEIKKAEGKKNSVIYCICQILENL